MIAAFFRSILYVFARLLAGDLAAARRPRERSVKIIEKQLRKGFNEAESRGDYLRGFRSAVYVFCGPNSAEYSAVTEVLDAVEAEELNGGNHDKRA